MGKGGMKEHDKQKEQLVQRPRVRKKGVTRKGLNIPKDLESGWWWEHVRYHSRKGGGHGPGYIEPCRQT